MANGGVNSREDVYLGDGLFVRFDGWQVEIYSSNGREKTNRVFLEPAVLSSFMAYIEDLKKGLV